jgi:hypothetical protein
MLSFIGHVTNSSASGALDLISSIDEAKASAFTLTAYDFIAAHDIDKATAFLENAIQRGEYYFNPKTSVLFSHVCFCIYLTCFGQIIAQDTSRRLL